MVIDYLEQDEKLRPFYTHPVSLEGIKASIAARKQTHNHRQLLVDQLRKQYEGVALTPLQQENLTKLLHDNTFTITTAHQPNIFTGHLYFIYKILHTVKLADRLAEQLPDSQFVPFFYMGSEDADLEELGHINLNGEKLEWQTKQTGAVGRMLVDQELIKLIYRLAGELEVLEYGKELIEIFKTSYAIGTTIQQATFRLVNELFAEFGVLILIPDNANLKRPFNHIVKRELTEQFSHPLVEETGRQLGEHYKVQASGREVNLFYLIDDKRERIEKNSDGFQVSTLGLQWTMEEMLNELEEHPERFSANVILRGVFQEMILPNIAFIGGGGEIAYWLELKQVFEACAVPFPVLVVRNSFLLLNPWHIEQLRKLIFSIDEFFKPQLNLVNQLVKRESTFRLSLNEERDQMELVYNHLQQLTDAIDVTLSDYVSALKTKAAKTLDTLEKKILRAEKRKFEAQQRQIEKLKFQLFPNDSLQERVDNFAPYYAKHGKEWLKTVYNHSLGLEQEFGIISVVSE